MKKFWHSNATRLLEEEGAHPFPDPPWNRKPNAFIDRVGWPGTLLVGVHADNPLMSPSFLIHAGAEDWLHPAWRDHFYPAGLPDDWLLSYYNTQFQAVYLSAARWQAASPAEWAQWLDDTQPGFHFLLAEGAGVFPASPRVIVATPEWEAAHVWWLDDAPDLRALARRAAEQAAAGEAFYVISRQGNLGLLEQVNTLRQVLGY
jgi:hypothetical protein